MNKKEKSTISWIIDFASIHRYMYVVSIIFAVIGVVCSIVPYFFIARMIGELLNRNLDFNFYLIQCIWMALFWLFRVVCHSVSTTMSHKATFHVLGMIRKRVCDKLAKLPLGYVLDTPSGSIKNVIVERVDSIETALAHILPEFTSNILVPICILLYLFSLDWRMALVSMITIPIGILCYMGMTIDYEKNYRNTIEKTKALNDVAVEYIGGIEVIKAFGKTKSSYEKFVLAAKEGSDCYINWMRRCNIFMSMAFSVFPSALVGILPIGGYLYKTGSLSSSTFIMVMILALGLIGSILTCMSYSDDIARIKTIIGQVSDILTQKELERPKKLEKKFSDSSIILEDVCFGYHEKEVLHNINMEIKGGKVNALVGPSGSGKSTIAKLIDSLWDVSSGSIKYGGIDIKDIPLEKWNRIVAYVAQDNYLFDESVRENIRIGNPKATDKEVEEVAKRSGCHNFIMNLEYGYDTIVGGSGGHLSGGERQRISIARAMLKDASVVILDEATAYTDPENEAIVQAAVAKLVKGKTLIVIAHRLSTIIDSDCIFVVDGGRIVANGTHNNLLKISPLYSSMWKSHISVKDVVSVEGGVINA